MAKSITLGNGNLTVCLDRFGQVSDVYFPYVGLENHTRGFYTHRVGIWADGTLDWLSGSNWRIDIGCREDALEGRIRAENPALGIVLEFSDIVYNEKDIFVRKVVITNTTPRKREIKLYFHHAFAIYESRRGDTAYYDPAQNAVVHYDGRRIFLMSGRVRERGFDDYTTGIFGIEGKEGSHRDAEDGVLSKNPIEHGPSDSVIGFYLDIDAGKTETVHYWLAAAETMKEVAVLNQYILLKSPEHLIQTTADFWHAWVNRYNFSFYGLSEEAIRIFKKSLLVIRAHADNRGGIIASVDSSMLQYGRDTYGYVWPRDAAFSAMALDSAGDHNLTKRFFGFCNDVVSEGGYFMHKYRPDRSLGSSWHPWIRNGKLELPIQEDETAAVLFALWNHYAISRDLEFIEQIYDSLIKRAADFMTAHCDPYLKLPKASYDLWEEKFGTSTYTASAVYGALSAAARFSGILGKRGNEERYRQAADEIKQSILKYLYNPGEQMFYKMINPLNVALKIDRTLDMSTAAGLLRFGVLSADDERLEKFMTHIEERLRCKTPLGGVARYEGDIYYRTSEGIPGNPWIITTMWLAQYYIARGKEVGDLTPAKELIEWAVRHASTAGILPEQLDPYTGAHVSASPLAWSHAEYVLTIIQYLDKLESLGVCVKCNPVNG